jgi:hypothetical protein
VAAVLLLLTVLGLGSCASVSEYAAPGGRLSVVVSADTDPPDRIWQITSRGPGKDWSVGWLSDDGAGGTFRDIRWIDAGSFTIVTSEDTIMVKVDASGRPAAPGHDLGLRPCP